MNKMAKGDEHLELADSATVLFQQCLCNGTLTTVL